MVDALYHQSPAHLPATLTACPCAHCLPEADRDRMIATPVRDLPADLIRAYTDSAHGVPPDPKDLRALLPRYVDLMTQGEAVEGLGLCIGLRRFGDARAQVPALFDAPTLGLLDDWARLMILRLGHTGPPHPAPPQDAAMTLLQTLIIGGWPVDSVAAPFEALFATARGAAARLALLQTMGMALDRRGHLGFDAIARNRPTAAPALADWLNRLLQSPQINHLLMTTDPQDAPWAGALWVVAGNITADLITAAAAP